MKPPPNAAQGVGAEPAHHPSLCPQALPQEAPCAGAEAEAAACPGPGKAGATGVWENACAIAEASTAASLSSESIAGEAPCVDASAPV